MCLLQPGVRIRLSMTDPAFELLSLLIGWSFPVFFFAWLYLGMPSIENLFVTSTDSSFRKYCWTVGILAPTVCAWIELLFGPVKLGNSRLFSLGGLVFLAVTWLQLGVSVVHRYSEKKCRQERRSDHDN